MTEAQKRLRQLLDAQSKDRQRAIEISKDENLTDETRAELDAIENRAADTERQIRAARLAVDDEEATDKTTTPADNDDPEMRERLELRGRCTVTRYLSAALRGRAPDGAEAELQQAAGVDGIPFELWEPTAEDRAAAEQRAITAAPTSGTGVNLAPLQPFVFAPSVAGGLMIDMPTVESGSYSSGTLSTAATAGFEPKGDDVPETAALWTTQTTTPHRLGASLNLALEDIATVGTANFEALLRQHISLAVSDALDDAVLNGAGTGDNIHGIIARLAAIANPTDPTNVSAFDDFVSAFADSIDGLWSTTMSSVAMLVGVDTYRLAAKAFRDAGNNDRGDIAFSDYAMAHTAGFSTNKRMPAASSDIQRAIVCRKGRSMNPSPVRTAVCPTWGYFTIDDIYTGARKGERRYVINTLIGDVILVQPDAYTLREFKVA